MIDRQKLETLLSRPFAGASRNQIASAANAIMGLDHEWEEVDAESEFGFSAVSHCPDTCALAREARAGNEVRLLRRRGP